MLRLAASTAMCLSLHKKHEKKTMRTMCANNCLFRPFALVAVNFKKL